MILIFVVTPGSLIYVLSHKKEGLNGVSFKNQYGVLYDEFKAHSKFQIGFYLAFVVRRFLFIAFMFNMRN
jgi:hypothetical protein